MRDALKNAIHNAILFECKLPHQESGLDKSCLSSQNDICFSNSKQRWTRGYKRYKETSGLIEWKECQIFHSIFT